MKASIFAQLVAFHWQLSCAAATPVNEPRTTTDIEPYMQKKAFTIQVDCNELINQILKGIDNYPFFAGQVVAVGKKVVLPSTTAFSICKTFKPQSVDCKYAAISIGSSISLAMIHGFIDLNPPKDGATSATSSKRSPFHEQIGDYLRSRGAEFEGISVQPLMDRREASADGDGSGHFVEVRGVHERGQDVTTDFHIYSRHDGSGDVRAIPYTEDHLGRRAGTAGYKTAWEVSSRNGVPPRPAITGLAEVVQDDWQSRVESDHNIGDYIGLVDFGGTGRIQFRIIPESGGFGENFETVDKCSK
ncbi:hypothetical protein Hte_005605 [Hypoxylon texense]